MTLFRFYEGGLESRRAHWFAVRRASRRILTLCEDLENETFTNLWAHCFVVELDHLSVDTQVRCGAAGEVQITSLAIAHERQKFVEFAMVVWGCS